MKDENNSLVKIVPNRTSKITLYYDVCVRNKLTAKWQNVNTFDDLKTAKESAENHLARILAEHEEIKKFHSLNPVIYL